MAGGYNFGCGFYSTLKILGDDTDCRGSAEAAVMGWPKSVEQIFNLNELGPLALAGGTLATCTEEANPCRRAYTDWGVGTLGHPSWDLIDILLSVRGFDKSYLSDV